MGTLFILAFFAPLLASPESLQVSLEHNLASPSKEFPLGCDINGRNILSILIYGARLSLEIGILSTALCLLIGLILGSLAGYAGGWIDTILMRILDIVFAFPGILLAIAIATVMGASKTNIIIALVATGWAGYTRLVRGEIRALKETEFVQSARALGLHPVRIVFRHLWPNIVSPLAVAATFGVAGTILAEASLSFLGVGVSSDTPSWGILINQGKDLLMEAPHIATFPGLAIMITILGFNFLGEGLREKLDPKG